MMIKLKLMEKLKKLKLNKKYFIRMKKDEFYDLNKYDLSDLNIEEEYVTFKSNYKYEKRINRYRLFIRKIIKNNFLIFFSIFGTFLIFFVSNYYVREIRFENDLYFNEQIYNDVEKKFKKIGNIYLIKNSINEINNYLSTKYYNYSYVGIVRNTGKIYIVIKPLPEYEKVEKYGDEKGNLVSRYNAYVTGIKLKKGVSLITINQMVKKDEILITGNLKYHLSTNNVDDYIHPVGSVFGKVIEEVEIKVAKVSSVKMLSGKVTKYFQILINNKKILSSKKYYDEYEEVESSVFNALNFFRILRINQYEKEEIIVEHNEESSYQFACSEIQREFLKNKTDECEEIINYELINSKIENEFYVYKFRIKMIINIAKFVKIEY